MLSVGEMVPRYAVFAGYTVHGTTSTTTVGLCLVGTSAAPKFILTGDVVGVAVIVVVSVLLPIPSQSMPIIPVD